MPEDVNSRAVPTQPLVCLMQRSLHSASPDRFSNGSNVPDEYLSAIGGRSLVDEIVRDRFTGHCGQRHDIGAARFDGWHPDQPVLPIDVIEGQTGHFEGTQP